MGDILSNHVRWIGGDRGSEYEVEVQWDEEQSPDENYRNVYTWNVSQRNLHGGWTVLATSTNGGEIRSGSGEGVPNAMKAMQSMASFVEAWYEACEWQEHTGRQSDNGDLFPVSMWGFAEDCHGEFYIDTHTTNDDDEEVDQ